MSRLRTLGGLAALAAGLSLRAQPPKPTSAGQSQPSGGGPATAPRSVVFLDPAHGGPENGAALGGKLLEKDVTLALAAQLKTALTEAGFTVVASRDADPLTTVGADQRAESANRVHALACVVLHATAAGRGVHLYTSTLTAKEVQAVDDSGELAPFDPVPWDTAQAGYVRTSEELAAGLAAALGRANVPTLVAHGAVRPLDNLMCPAVALEVAPLPVSGSGSVGAGDAAYRQQVTTAVVQAMQAWRSHAEAAR